MFYYRIINAKPGEFQVTEIPQTEELKQQFGFVVLGADKTDAVCRYQKYQAKATDKDRMIAEAMHRLPVEFDWNPEQRPLKVWKA